MIPPIAMGLTLAHLRNEDYSLWREVQALFDQFRQVLLDAAYQATEKRS